ncbi:MAG: hypothetical protein Q8P18_22855 [Pseudomonadota bacterium]|nr:hypothetical protein [Pseudomonadota bacterium]
MSALPRLGALGALAALVFSPSARAGAPPAPAAKVPVEMSFVTERGAEGLVVRMYAHNTSKSVVKIDDNPSLRSAGVRAADGTLTELDILPTMEMMSRSGPRRVWMPVQPGETLLVGSATLMMDKDAKLPVGGLELSVSVMTPEASSVVQQTVVLGEPGV